MQPVTGFVANVPSSMRTDHGSIESHPIAHVAVRMLRLLFQTTLAALQLAAAPWGWWRLLRTLADVNRVCDEDLRRLLQEGLTA